MSRDDATTRDLVVEAEGGSRGDPGPAGYGALVRDGATGEVLAERAMFLGATTDDVAGYAGLVAGLRAAARIDPDARVTVRTRSRLVVEQMSGRRQIERDDVRRLAAEAAAVLPPEQVTYEWVPRAQNADADRLATRATDTEGRFVRDHPRAAPSGAEPLVGTDEAGPSASGGRTVGDDARPGAAPALTVVLVRSAQTPAGAVAGSGRSTGPGESLTARGRTQAARAADLVFRLGRSAWADLTRPSVLVAAPTARSQETALAVGRRLGLSVTTDERLGPSSPDGGEEVRAVLEDLVRTHLVDAPTGSTGPADRGAVVVADAVQVRAAIGVAVQAAPARWSLLRVPPGSVSILRLWGDGTTELVAAGVPGDL